MRDFERWTAYLAECEPLRFAWGEHDCVLFAAGAVEAITGRAIRAGLPVWHDEAEAMQTLDSLGGLVAAVSGQLAPIPVAMAMRGDIGVVATPQGPALVVIDGASVIGLDPVRGRVHLPRKLLIQAWSAEA